MIEFWGSLTLRGSDTSGNQEKRLEDWKETVSEVGGTQVKKLFCLGGAINSVEKELTIGN